MPPQSLQSMARCFKGTLAHKWLFDALHISSTHLHTTLLRTQLGFMWYFVIFSKAPTKPTEHSHQKTPRHLKQIIQWCTAQYNIYVSFHFAVPTTPSLWRILSTHTYTHKHTHTSSLIGTLLSGTPCAVWICELRSGAVGAQEFWINHMGADQVSRCCVPHKLCTYFLLYCYIYINRLPYC